MVTITGTIDPESLRPTIGSFVIAHVPNTINAVAYVNNFGDAQYIMAHLPEGSAKSSLPKGGIFDVTFNAKDVDVLLSAVLQKNPSRAIIQTQDRDVAAKILNTITELAKANEPTQTLLR